MPRNAASAFIVQRRYTIEAVLPQDTSTQTHLACHGLLPGMEFTYLGTAPAGEPHLIRTCHGNMAIRTALLAQLAIRPCADHDC